MLVLCIAGVLRMAQGAMIPAKAIVAQALLQRAFAQGLDDRRSVRPWPWADMRAVARLRIARLGLDQIVLDTGSGQAMAFAPTVLPGGARIGRPGTTVIAAHRDTHFRALGSIRAGDRIDVETIDGHRHPYRVERAEIVRWDRFTIPADGAREHLVLATCYPFEAIGHGPLRFAIWARPEA